MKYYLIFALGLFGCMPKTMQDNLRPTPEGDVWMVVHDDMRGDKLLYCRKLQPNAVKFFCFDGIYPNDSKTIQESGK